MRKIRAEKPWAVLKVSRKQYEAARPWKGANLTREKYEEIILLLPDGFVDAVLLDADAEKLVAAAFGGCGGEG